MNDYRDHRRERVKERLSRLRAIASKTSRVYQSEIKEDEYSAWKIVNTRGLNGGAQTLIPGAMSPYIEWCEENCTGRYLVIRKKIHFESDDDAAFFLVVWE